MTVTVEFAYGRRPVVLPPPWTEEHGRRVRHRASRRLERLACGEHRDPLEHAHRHRPPELPQTFGLDAEELTREANRLFRSGWSIEEVTLRLAVDPPRSVA